MPFDGNTYTEESDALDVQSTALKSSTSRLTLAIAVGIGAIAGGIAVSFISGKTTFAPAVMSVPQPGKITEGQCDLRQIPLGTPSDMVERMCGKPSEINGGKQWVYTLSHYAYMTDGKLSSWQWDGDDSFRAANVAVISTGPGSLVSPPGTAFWHKTTDVYLDSSGKVLSTSEGMHAIVGEWCHPGYRP